MNNIALLIEEWANNLGFAALLFTLVMYWIEFNFFPNVDEQKNLEPKFKRVNNDSLNLSNSNRFVNLTNEWEKNKIVDPPSSIKDNDPATVIGIKLKKQSIANQSMILANILIATSLGTRWLESGHFPLSNLYESLLFLSWTITFLHLTFSNYGFLWLGMITTPTALILNAFASFNLPETMKLSGPLVPALQSNWLMMHVSLMIISYGTLLLGSLIAMIFLVIEGASTGANKDGFSETSKRTDEQENLNALLPLGTIETNSLLEIQNSTSSVSAFAKSNTELSQRGTKLKESLDNISYRLIGLGFPLLTIGIISGAVWANEAWGSYWSWDPKETWALITWLNFAIYLHTRLNKGWQGKKAAYVASIGFIILWICYLGVNLLGKGLHSYGFFS